MASVEIATGPGGTLLEACFAEWLTHGGPKLPSGRRGEAVELLTRVVADPALLTAYAADVAARRKALGPDAERRLRHFAGTDVPGGAILEFGFGGVDEDVLADLLTSPEALLGLVDVRFSGPGVPGEWFSDAVRRRERDRPDAAERTARTRAIVEAALDQTAHSAAGERPTAEVSPSVLSSTKGRTSRAGWVTALTVAASLFVGLGLGWSVWSKSEGPASYVTVTKDSNARGGPSKGISPAVAVVENNGPRPVFVAVVGFRPGKPPGVYYKTENAYLHVDPRQTGRIEYYDNQVSGSTAHLVVVTETPAGEVLNQLLANDQSNDPVQLQKKLLTDLRGLGYRNPRADLLDVQ